MIAMSLEENFRVLDSKEKEDKVAVENAPSILDFLDEETVILHNINENLGVDYNTDNTMLWWASEFALQPSFLSLELDEAMT